MASTVITAATAKKNTLRNSTIIKSILVVLLMHTQSWAQISRLGDNIELSSSLTVVGSSGATSPFWFSNNRYGLGASSCNFGYLRVGAARDIDADSKHNWRFGYGANVIGALGLESHFVLQQLYADLQWKALRLSLGQKERPLEGKDNYLSSGAMTTGINARPLPQIRLELPDFLTIPGTKDWLAVKAHIAYGFYTDNKWQRHFTSPNDLRTANSYYHSKAGFLRIGNKDVFPLTITGGFEMSAQFGGEAWNLRERMDDGGTIIPYNKMPGGIKAFWNAFIPGGNDVNDGDYSNVEGNQLGSWHLRIDYHGKGWEVGLYAEHFFEDHSQLFWQYGWKDMQLGVEARLPKNPFMSRIVYEYLGTMDQSGPIYHDKTPNVPEQISGKDNYYNHHIYGVWQHAGFVMGNPLLISPLYNKDGKIYAYHNRVKAHHIGLSGQPARNISWRILYTHERSLGTYDKPTINPESANYLMIEGTYNLCCVPGLSVSLAYGHNGGGILGKSNGGMATIAYNKLFNKK